MRLKGSRRVRPVWAASGVGRWGDCDYAVPEGHGVSFQGYTLDHSGVVTVERPGPGPGRNDCCDLADIYYRAVVVFGDGRQGPSTV